MTCECFFIIAVRCGQIYYIFYIIINRKILLHNYCYRLLINHLSYSFINLFIITYLYRSNFIEHRFLFIFYFCFVSIQLNKSSIQYSQTQQVLITTTYGSHQTKINYIVNVQTIL